MQAHTISFLSSSLSSSSSYCAASVTLPRRELSIFFLNVPSSRSSFPSLSATRLVVSASLLRRKGTYGHRGKSFSLREKLVRKDVTHQVREKFSSASDSKSEFEQEHVGDVTDVNSGDDENGLGNSLDFERKEERHDDVVSKGSALWGEMDSWVERYKRDNEVWGFGTGPIFVIHEDSKKNIVRVDVNEDEIMKRNQIKLWSVRQKKIEEEEENLQVEFGVSSRFLRARAIADEIKSGEYKIPRNSSIAKFLGEGERVSQVDRICAVISQGKKTIMKLPPKLGFMVFLGIIVLWVMKKSLFTSDDNRIEMTSEENEMLNRKLKARRERSLMVKGSVEVLNNCSESKIDKRPELDKNELMKNVLKAKNSAKLTSGKFEKKVEEIRQMARRVRGFDVENFQSNHSNSNDMKVQLETNVSVDSLADVDTEATPNIQDSFSEKKHSPDVSLENPSLSGKNPVTVNPRIIRSVKEAREYLSRNWEISKDELHQPLCDSSSIQSSHDDGVVSVTKRGPTMSSRHNEAVGIKYNMENVSSPTENSDKIFCLEKNTNGHSHESFKANGSKLGFPSDDPELDDVAGSKDGLLKLGVKDHNSNIKDSSPNKEISNIKVVLESNSQNDAIKISNYNSIQMENGIPNNVLDPLLPASSVEPHYEDTIFPIEKDDDHLQTMSYSNDIFKDLESDDKKTQSSDNIDVPKCEKKSKHESESAKHSEAPVTSNWLDENFDVCLPVLEKIRDGVRENYKIAKKNAEEGKIVNTNLNELGLVGNDDELEWMSDDKLRDIVFQVRDNELAGRDPFHSMTDDDQSAFFNGLEKKAEKMNTKLLGLHDYLHSRIENLNYGAGTSFV